MASPNQHDNPEPLKEWPPLDGSFPVLCIGVVNGAGETCWIKGIYMQHPTDSESRMWGIEDAADKINGFSIQTVGQGTPDQWHLDKQ